MKQYVILILTMCGSAVADATLADDIEEFVALFPTDTTISDIVISYLNDEEKMKAISTGVGSLTNLPEFETVKKFVEDAGLEPSVAINAMSRILGMSNLVIAWSSQEKTSKVIINEGFEGFLDKVLAAFPTESIGSLHEKKLISSQVFASFVEKITSQEFHERLTALQATKECQELFKLLSPRVNLFDFVNLFASAIGLGSNGVAYDDQHPTNSLYEINDNETEDLKVVPKIGDAINSLKTERFSELFDSLKNTKEYQALEKAFRDAGLDLKSLYRKLHQKIVQDYSDIHESESSPAIIEKIRKFLEDHHDTMEAEKRLIKIQELLLSFKVSKKSD